MSKNNINLKYAKSDSSFLSNFKEIKKLLAMKKGAVSFDINDENEISRGETYAVLPGLKNSAEPITIQRFRAELSRQGILDENFQNKILTMLLQNRAGIQFRLGANILKVIRDKANDTPFALGQEDSELELNIIDSTHAELTYKVTINQKDEWTGTPTKAYKAAVTASISPEKVVIKDFDISKVNKGDVIDRVFATLQKEQKNIFSQLLTYIKHTLGYDKELCIEDENENNTRLSL